MASLAGAAAVRKLHALWLCFNADAAIVGVFIGQGYNLVTERLGYCFLGTVGLYEPIVATFLSYATSLMRTWCNFYIHCPAGLNLDPCYCEARVPTTAPDMCLKNSTYYTEYTV